MFYKKESEELINGGELISTPSVTLTKETKDLYTYPQDGWYWFDTFDEALQFFAGLKLSNSITPRQARFVLLDEGLLDNVEAIVKLDRKYEIYWEYSTEIIRDDVVLLQLATALEITSEKLDEMFIKASKL